MANLMGLDDPNMSSKTNYVGVATGYITHGAQQQQQQQQQAMMGQSQQPPSQQQPQQQQLLDQFSQMDPALQPPPLPAFYRLCGCIECYNPRRENFEYDYTYDDATGKKPPQAYPRIRERGEYYIDSYNGEPWSCSFGTNESVCGLDVVFV
jgi:hypothetical protein